jgi:hypothetical protein
VHLSPAEECRGRVERALAAMAAATGRNARREMQLNAALAASLKYSRGAVAEIEASATKALQIAQGRDDIEYQLRSLWHLWSFRITAGMHRAALTMAKRFQALATKRSDPDDRLIGERMIGGSQYYLGDLPNARRHLERVLAHDAAPAQRWQFVRFQVDPRAGARAYLARILWLRGLPDQATRTADSSLEDAQRRLTGSRWVLLLPRRLARSRFGPAIWPRRNIMWKCFSTIRQGTSSGAGASLAAATRDLLSSSAAISKAEYRSCGPPSPNQPQPSPSRGCLRSLYQRPRVMPGRSPTGFPRSLRVKGETLLWRGAPGAAVEAEGHFRRARPARQHGARSWELRAATSLARLWHEQARGKAAHELLASVYDRFTEGFTTANLRAAKSLLEELL